MINYLESESLNYIMAASMYPNVKSAIWGLNEWVSLTKGIELNEMVLAIKTASQDGMSLLKNEQTYVLMLEEKKLFEDLSGYRYSCFVTNLDLPLDQVWNIYNTRADCENIIKELK